MYVELKDDSSEVQSSGNLSFPIYTSSVEGFVGYMEKITYCLSQTGLYYEWIWLKISIARQHIMEFSHTDFQRNLRNGVRGT